MGRRARAVCPSIAIPGVALAAALPVVLWSCGSSENPMAPAVTTGSVTVTVATAGPDAPASYTVALDGGPPRPIDANGTTTFTPLSAGSHTLTLGSIPANCTVAGANPRTAEVFAGSSSGIGFSVSCVPLVGGIQVRTTTSGEDIDPDGYTVDLDAASSAPIGANATITFADVFLGTHSLMLGGIASNCAVSGDNPAEATVEANQTDLVVFELICTALTGDLRVTANTSGAPIDPDGYLASVDGGSQQSLGVNGDTLIFEAVLAGDRTVLLAEIDPGCFAAGDNPTTATVPADGETLVVFDVTCTTDLGALELTTATTGVDTDPDGYTVSLDGGAAQPIGADDVQVYTDLAAGSHSLLLAGIAGHCSVQGPNPSMPVVTPDETAHVTMVVDCEDIPNLLPVAAIASPDTTPSIPPLSVTPGTSVTFTGSAVDPEDGTLTGASLVWTSNVDGEIGTGQTFMTSSLSEGQHTITLTATDSELGAGTATALVIVVPPPAAGYQIHLRLERGTTLTPAQAIAINDALDRLESIITDDVPDTPIDRPAFNCGASVPPTDETVDDLIVYLAIEPIDGPGGILGAAGPCLVRTASSIPVLGGMRFDADDLTTLIEPAGLLDEVLLHEAMHVMGFGTIWQDLGFLEDPSDPARGGISGADTHFDGAAAITQFLALGGASYTGGAVVPVENDNSSFGSGSLDSHWRESVFGNEIMTPAVNGGTNPLSILTVGQFEDLGYAVDLMAADPYSRMFSLRLGEPDAKLYLGDDILRGPLWAVAPDGRAVRLR